MLAARRKPSTDLSVLFFFSPFSPFSASVSFQADSPLQRPNTEEEEERTRERGELRNREREGGRERKRGAKKKKIKR